MAGKSTRRRLGVRNTAGGEKKQPQANKVKETPKERPSRESVKKQKDDEGVSLKRTRKSECTYGSDDDENTLGIVAKKSAPRLKCLRKMKEPFPKQKLMKTVMTVL